MATRINKNLSEIGHCSRRGADKLLEQGRITINGTVPELGEKVQEGDVVAVDGKVVGEFIGCDAVPTFYDELREQGVVFDLSLFNRRAA